MKKHHFAAIPAVAILIWVMKQPRTWVYNVLVAGDVFLNALGGGDPDMTISLRSARAARAGSRAGKVMCRFLDLFQPGHCEKQFGSEEGVEEDAHR